MIRARYSALNKEILLGILKSEDENVTRTKITYSLIQWLQRLEDYFKDNSGSQVLEIEPSELKNDSIDELRNIFGSELDLEANVDNSISIIKELSNEEQFLKPIALYFAGRIGAGKSTSCNKFLDKNKVGYFDTTKQITHSGFTTGLSIFDLPGQNGEPFFENVSRVALGLPIIEQHRKFNFGKPNSEKFLYLKRSPKEVVEEREFDLLEWCTFAEKENISPDIIIYVIKIGDSQIIINDDKEFICELIELLKYKHKNDKIIFLFNDIGGTNEEIYNLFRKDIESCYSMVFKEESSQSPMIFLVNALTGEGFFDFIKYLCEILPSETIGKIKELFHQDFKEEVKKHLASKFYDNNVKIASKLSKFHPYESNKSISIFESSIIAIIGLAKHFLVNYEVKKHKQFFDNAQTVLLEIAKENLIETAIPKTIYVPVVEKKLEPVEITNKDIDDFISQKMLDDIFYKSKNLSELRDEADDLLEEYSSMTTTVDVEYDAVIKYEEKKFYEPITLQMPILGTKLIPYDDYTLRISGKKLAIKNSDPKHLEVECNKRPETHKVANAVIGYRDEEIKIDYKKGGIPFISFILGSTLELMKIINEQELNQLKPMHLKKQVQEAIKRIRTKIESKKAELFDNIESKNKDSEENIKNIITSLFKIR